MMEFVDFSDCKKNIRVYGGQSGRKLGIIYKENNYLLKFPGSTKEMKNVKLSYTNSPISEYIGSQIYKTIGLNVHETLLGSYHDKIVVACKDFCATNEKLYPFGDIKVTFEPHFLDSNGNETNGAGMDLQEILQTIEEHPLFQNIQGVKERFWDMFVVDALIGNPDRNNGNWGLIVTGEEYIKLAPIFDNGNCLNNKLDENTMKNILKDYSKMKTVAYEGCTCIFELQDKRINPYHYIQKGKNIECTKAIKRVFPNINLKLMNRLIDDIPLIHGEHTIFSDTQKEFYKKVIEMRYKEVLIPAYEKTLIEGKNVKEKHRR